LEEQLMASTERVRQLENEIRMTKFKLIESPVSAEAAAPTSQT
jgi:hypothetical protein